jgi:hypothetical protein
MRIQIMVAERFALALASALAFNLSGCHGTTPPAPPAPLAVASVEPTVLAPVIITAKRLTAEQKAQMRREDDTALLARAE